MLLKLNNIYGGYGNCDIVKGVSLEVDAGEILCLVGPNGCGKTTLFRLILGSVQCSKGNILLNGQDIKTLSRRKLANLIAYIPQYHTPVFSYTVLEMVMMGRASHFSAFDSPKLPDREAAFTALKKVNALNLANKKYTALSGGQRQLILIARAICQSARILIMDEPAANLDYANQYLLMEVITDLSKNGYCIVMSTHSPETPVYSDSKTLLMNHGTVAAFGKSQDVITSENMKKIYNIEMDVITIKDRYNMDRTICLPVKNPDN